MFSNKKGQDWNGFLITWAKKETSSPSFSQPILIRFWFFEEAFERYIFINIQQFDKTMWHFVIDSYQWNRKNPKIYFSSKTISIQTKCWIGKCCVQSFYCYWKVWHKQLRGFCNLSRITLSKQIALTNLLMVKAWVAKPQMHRIHKFSSRFSVIVTPIVR